jgi:membrane protein
LLSLIGMVLLVVGPMVTDFFLERFNAVWLHVVLSSGVRWSIAIAFMLIATTFIYWIIPSADFPFTWISAGSVFATVGWLLGTQGLRIYVENFGRYNETYGALGAVIVLLLWLYLSGAILMMGGQINAVLHKAQHGSLSE